jgi:hypothetical protein
MGHNLGITFPENEDIYHSTETSDIMYKYINSQQNYSQYEKQIIHSVATSSAYGRLYDVDRHPINRPTSIYQGDNIALEFYDSAPSNDGYYHKVTNSQGGCTTCGWDSYWNIDVHNNVLRCNGDRVANETLTYGILYKEQPTASSPKFIMGFDFSLGVNKESEVEPEPKPEAPYFSLAFNTFTGSYVASPLQPFTKYRYHMIGSHVPDNAEYLWMYRARVGYNLSLQDATYNIVKGYYTYTGKYAYVTAPADGYYALQGRFREDSDSPWSSAGTLSIEVEGGIILLMAPNPVNSISETTISLQSTTINIDYNEGWDLEVVDISYGMKVKTKVKKKEYKLKTHGWKAGTYVVVAKYEDIVVTSKLKVK